MLVQRANNYYQSSILATNCIDFTDGRDLRTLSSARSLKQIRLTNFTWHCVLQSIHTFVNNNILSAVLGQFVTSTPNISRNKSSCFRTSITRQTCFLHCCPAEPVSFASRHLNVCHRGTDVIHFHLHFIVYRNRYDLCSKQKSTLHSNRAVADCTRERQIERERKERRWVYRNVHCESIKHATQ